MNVPRKGKPIKKGKSTVIPSVSKAPQKTYTPRPDPNIIGPHNPSDRGYDAVHRQKLTEEAKTGYNASLTNQKGEVIKLWVTDVEAQFGLTGQVAQSRRIQQFFPRHMSQPIVMIKGVTASNKGYQDLSSFIRTAQVYSISERSFFDKQDYNKIVVGQSTYYDPTVRLAIYAGGTNTQRNHKGAHAAWILNGFIKNMKAGAERHVYATEYSFEFISLYGDGGRVWKDDIARFNQIASWADIFKQRGAEAAGQAVVESVKERVPDIDIGFGF